MGAVKIRLNCSMTVKCLCGKIFQSKWALSQHSAKCRSRGQSLSAKRQTSDGKAGKCDGISGKGARFNAPRNLSGTGLRRPADNFQPAPPSEGGTGYWEVHEALASDVRLNNLQVQVSGNGSAATDAISPDHQILRHSPVQLLTKSSIDPHDVDPQITLSTVSAGEDDAIDAYSSASD